MNQNNNYGNYQQDQNNNNQGNYYQNAQGYNQVNYQNTGYNQTNPYQPQNFNAPQAPQAPQKAPALPGKGLGIAGFILSLVSFNMCFFIYLAIPAAIAGLVLSIVSNSQAKAVGRKNGLATAGIIVSIVSLALLTLLLIIGASVTSILS